MIFFISASLFLSSVTSLADQPKMDRKPAHFLDTVMWADSPIISATLPCYNWGNPGPTTQDSKGSAKYDSDKLKDGLKRIYADGYKLVSVVKLDAEKNLATNVCSFIFSK